MSKSIVNVSKFDCTGCGACVNACPVDAIKMEYDNDGFMYPVVSDSCIDCGKCSLVCQAVNPLEKYETPKAYALMAAEQIRAASSSGGFFSLVATYVIAKGGVVFGAVYTEDYRRVYITKAETVAEIAPMRGSKYVFCETKNTYKEAKELLDAGRLVLYTGTPCEIAGLRLFLGKEYENLILVDFVCHGANSVKAYDSWLDEFTEGKELERLDFRDKHFYKWSTPAVAYLKDGSVSKQSHDECYWYRGFLEGVINRDNCSHCEYACAERISDITMGDAWQVGRLNPAYNDGIGTSLILVNSEKGKDVFEKVQSELKDIVTLCEEIPLEEIRKYNGSINFPQKQSPARKYFFSHIDKFGFHKALWYGRGRRWDFGIVGWWFASNYGSALTYYALASFLDSLGKASIFIPIPKLDGTPWDADTKIVEDFIGKYFRIANKRDMDHMIEMNHFCDAFMLGSDQMWTEITTKLVGYTFFLDFVSPEKKKIACAPSFGAGRYSTDSKMRFTARDYLKRFDSISVREQSGVEICDEVFGIQAQQILDPIFWVDLDVYDKLAEKAAQKDLPEKYMLCYVLDPTDEKVKIAERIAAERGLELITILGMREAKYTRDSWKIGRILDNASIEDFVYAIQNCSYMFTDSHHGVCMAIKYNKNYVAIGNEARGIDRFTTVANLLGLEERIIRFPQQGEKEAVKLRDINYKSVNKKLDAEINRGKNWLVDAIEKPTQPVEETVYTLLRRIESLENELASLRK